MKVFIDNTYNEQGEVKGQLYVESDAMQFIIKEYTGKFTLDKKTGKEIPLYNTIGYYPNVKFCIERIVKMKVMESTATNLRELLEDMKRIEAYIASKFEPEAVTERTGA